jgi:hypothetical protein
MATRLLRSVHATATRMLDPSQYGWKRRERAPRV